MKYIRVPVYAYDELDEQAQLRALNSLLHAWRDCVSLVPEKALDGYRKAQDEVERLQTPWFFQEALYDHCREAVDEVLNSFYYTVDGRTPVTTLEVIA